MFDRPLLLMVHNDRAWLVSGGWSRSVAPTDFAAWAAYGGVDLRQVADGGSSREVVLATARQRRMFAEAWGEPAAQGAFM